MSEVDHLDESGHGTEAAEAELVELQNTAQYLTLAIYGPQGTGKTRMGVGAAVYVAEREAEKEGSPGPIAVFDTENRVFHAVKLYRYRLEKAGIQTLGPRVRSRRFEDLLNFVEQAKRAGAHVLLVDQLTHVRRDVEAAYRAEHPDKTTLGPSDREAINVVFRRFTDAIVNIPMHVILVGRAKDNYEDEADEGGGRRTVRAGVTIDAGRDLAYEPMVVIEMEPVPHSQRRKGRPFKPRAIVVKDNTGKIHGRRLAPPEGHDLGPVLDALDGVHEETDLAPSSGLFKSAAAARAEIERREEILAEISGRFAMHGMAGHGKEAVAARARAIHAAFGGITSEEALARLSVDVLEEGFTHLVKNLTAAPRREDGAS